jgi:hypothetical protein
MAFVLHVSLDALAGVPLDNESEWEPAEAALVWSLERPRQSA